MSNCEVFPGNFQHFQGTLMLLPSAKKEEKYFVYLKKTSPNWKIFFFLSLSFLGVGRIGFQFHSQVGKFNFLFQE